MRRYTLDLVYDVAFGARVTFDADTPEDACARAIDRADELEAWKSTDHVSDSYVTDILEHPADDQPPGEPSPIAVPDAYTRDGPPPTVTIDPDGPPAHLEVSDGTVRLRFRHPAFTLSSEISDPPPPPGNKPLVTIRRRADGAPDVTVTGGTAHVRVSGWNGNR